VFFQHADVQAIAPIHCTWDDHDFGANDCNLERRRRAERKVTRT